MTETLTTASAVPATFAGRRLTRTAAALASSGLLVGMGAVSATPAVAAEAADCDAGNTVNSGMGGTQNDIQVLLSDVTEPVVCLAGTFVLTSTLTLNRPVELFGLDAAELDGDGDQIINATAGSDLLVQNISFINGDAFEGGAIYIDGGLTVENSQFTGNTSYADGGAIFVAGSNTVDVIGSTFTDNSTGPEFGGDPYGGGAIYVDGTSTLFIEESTFSGNEASGAGGAVFAYVVVNDLSEFSDNTAPFGGAVYGAATISFESTFANNSAEEGGAVRAFLYAASIGSTFVGNAASESGGAIEAGLQGEGQGGYGAVVSLNSTFVDNTADSVGGAIVGEYGQIALSTFLDNEADAGIIFDHSDAIYAFGAEGSMEVGGNIFASSRFNRQLGAQEDDAYSDLGGNVFTTNEGTEAPLGTPDATTLFSQSAASIFGAGAGLADNGGPTQTVALVEGSPAIDVVPTLAIDIFAVSMPADSEFAPVREQLDDIADLLAASDTSEVDQRSVERTAIADAGAYEYGEAELAATGADDSTKSILGGLAALLLGAGAAFAIGTRRISRNGR